MQTGKLKIFIFSGFLALSLGSFLLAQPLTASAQNTAPPQDSATRCNNFKKQFIVGTGTNTSNVIANLPQFCSASGLATWLINLSLAFAGSVAIIFLIVGGYLYMASAGNEEGAQKAKKILLYSVLGLAVIIMAFAIVKIIGSLFTTAPK